MEHGSWKSITMAICLVSFFFVGNYGTYITTTNVVVLMFITTNLFNFSFTGRATLQNWSLILYGTKPFAITNDLNTKTKSKSGNNKKKNLKKQKIKPPKTVSRPKVKSPEITFKYNSLTKNKKLQKLIPEVTSEVSPYFYAVNSNKFKNSEESVKPYLKFVKNITITYPVIIPSRDNTKYRDPFRKSEKQKEKSRDINSNRNRNLNPVTLRTTVAAPTKGKNAGNL